MGPTMLLKSASNQENCSYPYIFTKNARTAWFKIIESISRKKGARARLLLPSYIGINEKEGSGVFDSVQNSGADYAFYKVTDTLQVDTEDFFQLIKNQKFDIALVIHYFGFSRINMEEIKAVCNENNVVLVEDCAHAFYLGAATESPGNYGDYCFYSLHKYLATTSGGLLKFNNKIYPMPELATEEMIEHHALAKFASSDFREIADIRRRNYRHYAEKIINDNNIQVLFLCSDNDIPQTFPLRIKNGLREKLYFYLLDSGIPTVALYYRMIPQIDSTEFELSYLISSEILNLPVHQDTTLADVELVCSKISDFFRGIDE